MKAHRAAIIGYVLAAVALLLLAFLLAPTIGNGERHGTTTVISRPSMAEGVSLPAQMEREDHLAEVDPGVEQDPSAFLARWQALVNDNSLRAQVEGPSEVQLQILLAEDGPMPFGPILNQLLDSGVVPPPSAEELLELSMMSIGTATQILTTQNRSLLRLKAFTAEDFENVRASQLTRQPLDYAPEFLASYMVRRPIQEELAANAPLVITLQEIRTQAILLFSPLWMEYQFRKHCSLDAGRNTKFQLPEHGTNEFLASLDPNFAALLEKIEAVKREYYGRIAYAVSMVYPDAKF